ncbi:MAG: NAD(P)-dependent alcohol dehydrogenase [Bacteroidetes bacterium]|nr:NAD(P)-dependent alcohol dehydrogenase [Bacteroidota bacterium]MDA1120452.1 NAD(P)-dependent alcohol dehydrogenase [Bacteroidota bacterium]
MMKAVLWTAYGSPEVLKLGEIEKPSPKDDEVLVKVRAAAVSPGDCELRRFDMHVLFWLPVRIYMGILKPKFLVPGMDLAGEVVGVGKDVKNFKPGDQVFGNTRLRLGAHAEYTCVKTSYPLSIKPDGITPEEASTLATAGSNALHYMRKAKIQPNEKVLIIGASGNFGTYALQLAKLFGAKVTGVDSTNKLDILREIGADQVIDYTQEDFTKHKESYDVIFDVRGSRSVPLIMKTLKPNGRYILATPWVGQVISGLCQEMLSKIRGTGKQFIFALANDTSEDLDYLKNLMADGKLKAVIDKSYTLEHVPEAHRYIESGEKIGNVVVSMEK